MPSQNFHARFFKRGFAHLHLLMKDKYNWLRFDPSMPVGCWEIMGFTAVEDVPGMLAEHYPVLACKTSVEHIDNFVMPKFRFWHCVEVIRYMTGIKARGWTPYQFYCNILKNNMGVKVHGW